jgi:hypothetical protein
MPKIRLEIELSLNRLHIDFRELNGAFYQGIHFLWR